MFSLGRVSVGQSSSERVEDVNGFGVADCNERMRDVSRNDIGVVRADFVTLAVFDYDKAAFDAIAELFAFVRVHCDFAALAEILKDDFGIVAPLVFSEFTPSFAGVVAETNSCRADVVQLVPVEEDVNAVFRDVDYLGENFDLL